MSDTSGAPPMTACATPQLLPRWAVEMRRRDMQAERVANERPTVAINLDGRRFVVITEGRSMALYEADDFPDAEPEEARVYLDAIAAVRSKATTTHGPVSRAALVGWAGPAEGYDEILTAFDREGHGPIIVSPIQRVVILFGVFVDANVLAHVLGVFGGDSVTVATGGECDGIVLTGEGADGKAAIAMVMPLALPSFDERVVRMHGWAK